MTGRQQPLDAMDALEAIAALDEVFTNTPSKFADALRQAASVRAYDFTNKITTVANQWAESHAVGLSERPESAVIVAQAILGNSDIMKQLKATSAKVWFIVLEALFPHFDLPRGWLRTAQEGGLLPGHIETFIMTRVRRINSKKAAEAEKEFILMLFSRPPRTELGYRKVLSRKERAEIVRIVGKYLPEVLKDTHADTISWRLF
ncbi:MAG TPA: hypothetical protein VJ841_04675 [Candidatus Saccharimonadales bacterium]|nr:hypothetical protein [Candidatus Saccharimonadales bacterium]